MDGLSSSFDEIVSTNNIQGVSLGNASISHLLYADDLLVFGKASIENAQILMDLLSCFADISGLKVNNDKNTILFSRNVLNVHCISSILNIPITSYLIKYLGIPIFHRRLKLIDFQPLLQKIYSSLDGWKAKTLSFAGRMQFIKFTICNTLGY
ncbi:hypothetical protein KFK09_019249 [Dendrobium nobile]|nr:hypothetical protein KFK09_019249 [Dendrobium nobile]